MRGMSASNSGFPGREEGLLRLSNRHHIEHFAPPALFYTLCTILCSALRGHIETVSEPHALDQLHL